MTAQPGRVLVMQGGEPRVQSREAVTLDASLEELRGEQADDERAQRELWLTRLGQTSAVLTHEARGFLHSLRIGLAVLERVPWTGLQADNPIRMMRNELDHLERLVNDVRDAARPLVVDRRPCDLSTIWRQAWRAVAASESREAHLHEAIDGASLQVLADADRVQQVFRNLFENALQACADPVELTVRCRDGLVDGVAVVSVVVQDNGPGLTAAQQASIFEPFYSTKTTGMGLGLAVARRILQAHGGSLAASSPSTGGAAFQLTLPLAPTTKPRISLQPPRC